MSHYNQMYGMGYLLMAWALITLGRNYQLGGIAPRSEDKLIMDGIYRLVRHPMYTAALSISLGLTCLIHTAHRQYAQPLLNWSVHSRHILTVESQHGDIKANAPRI